MRVSKEKDNNEYFAGHDSIEHIHLDVFSHELGTCECLANEKQEFGLLSI